MTSTPPPRSRPLLHLGITLGSQVLLVLFMLVVTVFLLLGESITMGQFIFRTMAYALVPPTAGAVAYFLAGRDPFKAANASFSMLVVLVVVFALNTRRAESRIEDTDIDRQEREHELDKPKSERITAWAAGATFEVDRRREFASGA